MREIIVLAHKRTVGSGAALANALGVRCITPRNTKVIRPDTLLVNYGVSTPLQFVTRHPVENTLNSPVPVGRAVNKLTSLRAMSNAHVSLPQFTEHLYEAHDWSQEGTEAERRVFCRTLLCASKGKGIIVATPDTLLDIANEIHVKLFTRNVPKTKEFRVHVVNGEAVSIAQKRQMSPEKLAELGISEVNRAIRSYENGWVFANEVVGTPPDLNRVKHEAVLAVNAHGLDFGAVDVLVTGPGATFSKVVVCEVNTAPSLDGETTLNNYVNVIKEIANEH